MLEKDLAGDDVRLTIDEGSYAEDAVVDVVGRLKGGVLS